MKDKVAYLFGSLNRGGAETLMLDVFRNVSKEDFDFVGIHRKDGPCKEEFYAVGKMIQCAPKRFGFFRYLWRLRKLLLKEHVSIIHGQQPIDTLYGALATIGTGIRVIQTFHGFYPMKGVSGLLTRLSIRMSDDLCFVSGYEQEWYQRQMKIADKKCHVIFNGVDFGKIDRAVGQDPIVKSEKVKLCMVGNFMTGRDHITLIKSLQMTNDQSYMTNLPSFDFYFIGKKSEATPYIFDKCVRICEENGMKNVHFLGARSDVPALLKQMDGFVYSTDHDTFGIAVVEAMAAGLPIVVNDWPVMKEVCGEIYENYVQYFKSKNVESCAEAIQQLLKDISTSSDGFKQRCKHNSVYVREKYSIENYIATLSHIYRKD